MAFLFICCCQCDMLCSWAIVPLLPRPRRGLRCIVFTLSVCLSVCVSVSVCLYVCLCVCPANILVFYFSAIRRDIDLKFIHDTYRVVLNSLKKYLHRSKLKLTGTVHCFFEGTVISQKLSRRIFFFFHRHLLGYSIRWKNTNLSEQRNDVTTNSSIFDVYHVKKHVKIKIIWQSYSPVLRIFSTSVSNLVTIGRHLT